MKTLLQIVQAVTGELLLNVPTAVLSNPDRTVKQLYALTVAACDELVDIYDWQQLERKYSITTVPAQSLYALPADYQRFLSDSAWDASQNWPMSGNTNQQTWQALTSGIAITGPYYRFRLTGNMFELLPTPGGAESMSIVYVSNYYVINPSLVDPQPVFQNDSDMTLFHDRTLINFVKLKWKETKGFDTTSALYDFNSSLETAKGMNVPSPSLFMAQPQVDWLLTNNNVPIGNVGM